MENIGARIKPVNQQLCFAHAIQLAVLDVLYDVAEMPTTQELSYGNTDDENDEEGDESESTDYIALAFLENSSVPLKFNYKSLIDKVRSVVSSFRKSPLKRDALKQYSKTEFKFEYELITDSKTRWNSLCDMLARFFKLEICIKKVMIDFKLTLNINDEEFEQLEDIVNVLQPVKEAVQAICRRDTNLVQADIIFDLLLKHLEHLDSELSSSLTDVSAHRKYKIFNSHFFEDSSFF